jgi:opacity protein-like surface antigen
MLKRPAAIVWALLLISIPASAEVAAPDPAAADEWHFAITPYIWGTAITGDVGAKGNTADVSASFSDILEDLNAGLMGTVEARQGRFIVLFDGFAAWLEDDVDQGARTIAVPSVPLVNATIGPSKVDVKLTQVVLDLKFGWRVLSLPTVALLGEAPASEDTRRFTLDLFGGGRYWYLKTELDLKVPVTLSVGLPPGTPLPPGLGDLELPGLTTDGIDRDIDADSDWVDPVVGARTGIDLTERISLSLLGDVGGFDIGSASKFSWKTNALLSWQLSESWMLVAGYQALNVQREKGDADADITMHGPLVGLGFQF